MKNKTPSNQEISINAARELLKPHKVRPGHIPRWFGQKNFARLAKTTILDHYGSVKVNGITYFVTEPYHICREDIDTLDDLCKAHNFTWLVDPNSWHFPCRTVRIVISNHDWQHPK